ncbi:MAG: trypsin-like peptidase domain-containing protein [Anaerolineales bacterium]|nr:trypsin-like peptidase domain-containing protein [Anaerolineales bacterium]
MSNVLVELSNAMAVAAEKAGVSTVMVNARRRMPASGIAFAIDLILTANHVVEREEGITVTLSDGVEVPATVAGRDHGTDLALLRLERPLAKPAETAQEAKVGQLVLALGRPSGAGIEASLGVVSAVGGPVHTRHGAIDKYIRTDTTPFPGFSGGPLVDVEGRVVGLNTSGFGHGVALTIPADLAWKVAEQLAKHGSIRRGYLGVRSQGVEIPETAQKALKREQTTGLILIGVEKDSPAEAAGLMVGDILVAIDGQPVQNHDELFTRLSGDVIDKSTPVEVLRGGQPQRINVKIGARK